MFNTTFKDNLLKNRFAVVTGGTSCIGMTTAFSLAELSAKVFCVRS